MTGNVIELENLRKVYRSRSGAIAAIDGLTLSVSAGGVFGFLGPNGSGKTTTIRCLLGLVKPTSGSLRLMGADVPQGLPIALRSVGAIVEGPALFPTLSGRENLLQLAAIHRIGARRVDAVIEEVGLASRATQSVRKYSLGMRQRLALAAALLKDPPLLILDEPANGLDPAGIRQVRELLRRLGAEGRTVFVSSHQLAEVEQVCDRVAILRSGRCVAEGSVAEVIARSRNGAASVVRLDDLDGACGELLSLGFEVHRLPDALRIVGEPGSLRGLSRVLGERGHWVTELREEERSLEDLFLELTDSSAPDALVLEEAR